MKSFSNTRRSGWLTCFKLFGVFCSFLLLSVDVGTIFATGSPSIAVSAFESGFRATTVFLVRHAEKAATPADDPPLLEAGSMRSKELARILAKAGIKAIYTSQFLRTRKTAEPLATSLGLTSITIPISMSASNPREVSQESIKEIAEAALKKSGENALIVGHSNTVPAVIKALGGDMVPTIDDKTFDDLFVVVVYAKGKAKVTHLKYGN